ncbi:Txe/YoeB family addiction module toxin [bacterium]|nr:Txe/YoeB family addiction module toxin [bacterium]
MKWKLVYTKQSQKDAQRLKQSKLKEKALNILDILQHDPFRSPPPFEKLVGDLSGAYSRRINIQHRVVYQVYKEKKTVKIIRMWTHYE